MKTSPHCRLLTNHHVSCFLSLKFWDFVFQSVAFIVNCLPPSTPPLLASYTKLFNHTPDYYFLGVIYGLCFHYFNPAMTIKLNFTPSHVIFLATPNHKGYKCLHICSKHVYISHQIYFEKTTFPFHLTSLPFTSHPFAFSPSSFILLKPQSANPPHLQPNNFIS